MASVEDIVDAGYKLYEKKDNVWKFYFPEKKTVGIDSFNIKKEMMSYLKYKLAIFVFVDRCPIDVQIYPDMVKNVSYKKGL